MADSVMTSKRAGVCNVCRGLISVGEEIRWNRNDGARHLVPCTPIVASDEDRALYLKQLTVDFKAWDGVGSYRPMAFGDWLFGR